jgi:hypothetical protein
MHDEFCCVSLRAASHYGCPNREAVGFNGQALLRVQRDGLKLANKIWELEPPTGLSVKPPKAKPKEQGRRSIPLHSLPKSNPSDLTVKILLVFEFLMEKRSMAS